MIDWFCGLSMIQQVLVLLGFSVIWITFAIVCCGVTDMFNPYFRD